MAALRDVALFTDNSRKERLTRDQYAKIETLFQDAAADPSLSLVRSTAAFGLWALAHATDDASVRERAYETLLVLVRDPKPNVRYNAATRLAIEGDERCLDVLAEMLFPDQVVAYDEEESRYRIDLDNPPGGDPTSGFTIDHLGAVVPQEAPSEAEIAEFQEKKRIAMLENAFRAIDSLVVMNPDADLSPLRESLTRLVDDELPLSDAAIVYEVRKQADRVLSEHLGVD
jgi:HEAT repeat protein